MRCRQVRKAIDSNMSGQIERDQRLAMLAHSEECAECRQALDSAAISASLIRARALQEIEPSQFFKTRVLAAIRERAVTTARQSAVRMWPSARAVVFSMFAFVALLLALNLLAPKRLEQTAVIDPGRNAYSIERVVLEDTNSASDESLTSGQVLDTVFAQGDSYGID